jgi:hypothetical protein
MRDNLSCGEAAYLNVRATTLLRACIRPVTVNLDVLDADPTEAPASDYSSCGISRCDLDRAPGAVGRVALRRYLLVLGGESNLACNLDKSAGTELDNSSRPSSGQSAIYGTLIAGADTSSRGKGQQSSQRQRSLAEALHDEKKLKKGIETGMEVNLLLSKQRMSHISSKPAAVGNV